jgi:hypothetical protein
MKYHIKESQYVYLLENLEKKKRLLNKIIGVDFTGKIKKITSSKDVPSDFDEGVGPVLIDQFIHYWGPMYLFKYYGKKYLYQGRDEYEMFIDEDGYDYVDGEILEHLGIDVTGLKFSDIIDIYSNEGEPLNENVNKKKRLFTKLLGEDLINSIREITSPNQLPKEFLKSIGTSVIQRYIDVYGPLYYFVLDGEPFLYKERISPRGEEYEMYITDKGKSYLDGEITDRLGLSDMGLNFSDVIDIIFNEGDDVITEDDEKMLRSRAQRRLSFIEELMNELDRDDVCDYWTNGEVDDYVYSSMANVVEQICDQIGSYDLYDEIYAYLVDKGYGTQFRDFFIDTKNNYC